jgi:putative hydrolase of the HAD superfamily
VTHANPELVARTAWDALESAMRQARASDLAEPDYGAVCREALIPLGLDVTREQAAAILDAAYVSGAEGGKAPYPDARSTLLELRRRGFRLGIVTNRAFGGERFRTDLREAGLDIGWDAAAVSVEVGYLKPHPALFEAALKELGATPAETLMVGNSLAEDVAGAQRLGMAAAWRRSAPDAEDVQPDYTFDDVAELLELPVLERSAT